MYARKEIKTNWQLEIVNIIVACVVIKLLWKVSDLYLTYTKRQSAYVRTVAIQAQVYVHYS